MDQQWLTADIGSATIKTMAAGLHDGEASLAEQPVTLTDQGWRQLLSQGTVGDSRRPRRVAICSAGGCLRLVAAGIRLDDTINDAKQAVRGTGVWLQGVLAGDDRRRRVEQAAWLEQLQPEAVLLLGGFDGAPLAALLPLVELLSLAPACRGLPVLHAGNQSARELLERWLGRHTRLQSLPNLHPVPGRSEFQATRRALTELQWRHQVNAWPGSAQLAAWADEPPLAAPAALLHLAEEMAAPEQRVMLLDIGATAITVVSTGARGTVASSTPLGVGRGLRQWPARLLAPLVAATGPEGQAALDQGGASWLCGQELLREWLPRLLVAAIGAAIDDHMAVLPPDPVVAPSQSGWLERLRPAAPPPLRPTQLIVSGLSISQLSLEQQLAAVLGCLRPNGLCQLTIDSHGLLTRLGLLPGAPGKQLLQQVCQPLATVIVPRGTMRRGQRWLRIRLDGGRSEQLLRAGELQVIAGTAKREVAVELLPARDVDLGAGPGQSLFARLRSSQLGLVVDGRVEQPSPVGA